MAVDAPTTSGGDSKVSMQCPWQEGEEGDFAELHRAIREGRTRRQDEALDPEEFSGRPRCLKPVKGVEWDREETPGDRQHQQEDDEDEEPPKEDRGPRFLWTAQNDERLQEMTELLRETSDLIGFRDSDGYTALHRAAYTNNAAGLAALLAANGDVLAQTNDGWTPLHSACRWNAADCVELLIEAGADLNAVSHGGQTPLHLAAFHGRSRQTLQVLFMAPGTMDGSIKNCQGETAEEIAVRYNNCPGYFKALKRSATNDFLE